MSVEKGELGHAIIDACLAMGFACAGIARAEPASRRAEFLSWIGDGRHGDMAFMTEYVEERLDVRRLLPGARSVIVVADQYAVRGDEEAEGDGVRIARYARGRDYHAVIKARLHALCDRVRELVPADGGGGMRFRAFVDTGPAMEREHAARAALGGAFIGKHTLLIHPRLGSWLLLGGVATTLELVGPGDDRQEAQAGRLCHPDQKTVDHCGTCTRCIDACPTGAIAADGWSVDATRCVSYLTLEHRGAIDERFHAGIGDRLIGCDECQAVCPFNTPHDGGAETRERVNPAYADHGGEGGRARLPILEVLGWGEEDRTRVLSGSAAKRASLEMIRRTAVINAANAWRASRDPALIRAIERVRDDAGESAVVRETARRVLEGM